jgi:hypothetical protein
MRTPMHSVKTRFLFRDLFVRDAAILSDEPALHAKHIGARLRRGVKVELRVENFQGRFDWSFLSLT